MEINIDINWGQNQFDQKITYQSPQKCLSPANRRRGSGVNKQVNWVISLTEIQDRNAKCYVMISIMMTKHQLHSSQNSCEIGVKLKLVFGMIKNKTNSKQNCVMKKATVLWKNDFKNLPNKQHQSDISNQSRVMLKKW